jgi:ferredoxin-NADP reductase
VAFNCVKTPDDLVFQGDFDLIASRYPRYTRFVSMSRPPADGSWTGLSGRLDAEMLATIAPDLHERWVYMCGPEGFMTATRELLESAGFDMTRFHQESFGGVRTSARTKLVAGTGSGGVPAAGTLKLEFARAGRSVMTDGTLSLLDVAEDNDVEVDYGCRIGSCGDCKVKLLAGTVDAETTDGLTDGEVAAGYVLACVARPTSACVLDV